MDCEKCSEDLTAYIDDELTEAKASDVKAHLALCEACREEYQSLELSARFVDSHLGEIEIRPQAWNSVRARISSMQATSPTPGLYQWLISNPWWGATATALVTLALTLGLWGYVRHQATQRDLMQYMSQYIQAREAQEQAAQVQVDSTGKPASDFEVFHPEYVNNPFVTVESTTDTNPFRSEDQ